jgi:hypothetical protein
MGKHLPSTVWATYPFDRYPYAYVATEGEDNVSIAFFPDLNGVGTGISLTRAHARLLAKRINQCLDETKS